MAKFVLPKPDQVYISDFPHLLKEWDYEKNEKLPTEVRRGSQKKYFWICPEGHSYLAQAMHRTSSNSGCPVCTGKLVTDANSLASCAPEVAALAHPKNVNFDPHKTHVGAHKTIWWKCDEGHEWKASVKSLTKLGTRCPSCLPNGRSVKFDPSFQSIYPNLRTMWDEQKNISNVHEEISTTSIANFYFKCAKNHKFTRYTPDLESNSFDGCGKCEEQRKKAEWEFFVAKLELEQQFSIKNKNVKLKSLSQGNDNKIIWKCNFGHEWTRTCKDIFRRKHNDCPTCKGSVISADYNWLVYNPKAMTEWDHDKNAHIDPSKEFPNSHTRAHFICSHGHSWMSELKARTEGRGCPKCSNQTSRPELRIFSELKLIFTDLKHRQRIEGKEADIVIPKEMIIIEFDGGYFHKNKKRNDLKKKHFFEGLGYHVINVRQAIEALDHSSICIPDRELKKADLNLITQKLLTIVNKRQLRDALNAYSARKSFWNEGFYRTCVSALPAPIFENSLQSVAPEIASEWDYELNHPLIPEHFTSRSSTKVHWRCKSDHVWEASIAARVGSDKQKGTACPYCVGNLASPENNFEVEYPELISEWDFSNNTKQPFEYTAYSKQKVWWVCSKCSLRFRQAIQARSFGSGCPECAMKNRLKSNIPISISHPGIYASIDKSKTGFDVSGLTQGSGKKVVFSCACGHQFVRQVGVATKKNSRCPKCKKLLNEA